MKVDSRSERAIRGYLQHSNIGAERTEILFARPHQTSLSFTAVPTNG
jgi:hypothetical protein